MSDEPKQQAWSRESLSAWGKALVKTGTEHLDLTMVRRGKETIANAAKMPATSEDQEPS